MSIDSENNFRSAHRASSVLSLAQNMEQIVEPRVADAAAERAREDQAEREYLNLIRWAMRRAPELLRSLRIAYLFGQHASPQNSADQAVSQIVAPSSGASRADAASPSEKLKDIEREHIRRVLKESANVVEAARRLGINCSTLWRKRKRYNL